MDGSVEAWLRTPDAAGKAYWVGELKKGMSRTAVVKGFAASNEFAALCKTYRIRP